MYNTARLNMLRMLLWITIIPSIIFLILNEPSLLWVVLIVYSIQQIVGFNAYMHRYVSHKSFDTYEPIKKVMAFLSVFSNTGSPISWAWIHRVHHRYDGTDKDPHCPRQMGFWKAMFCLHYVEVDNRRCAMKDVLSDPTMQFVHRWYFYIHLGTGLTILLIGGFNWFLAAYWIPSALHAIIIMYVLIVHTHMWGYRNFDCKGESTNSWFANFISLGEGWHNNHHANPGNYSFQYRWWEIDPTGLFIDVIKRR